MVNSLERQKHLSVYGSFACSWNTQHHTLKEERLVWSMISEGSAHGHQGSRAWGRGAHSMTARRQGGRRDDLGTGARFLVTSQ